MRKLLASLLFALPVYASAMPVELNETPVREFVRWYSDESGEPLAIAPSVQGTLTVYAADVLPAELPEFFQGVLSSHGFEVVPGNPPTVVMASEAPRDFTQHIALPEPREPLSTRVLSFDNIRAGDMASVVSAYLSSVSVAGQRVEPQVLHSSNSLLVSGTDSQLADLGQLLAQFDVPHPQVLIKAVLYETAEGDSFDLGVALGSASGSDIAGGVNTNALGNALSVAGGSFGVFDGDVLAVAVQALQRDTSATVLSTPQILTLSGQSGRISVGQNVPFVTGRIVGQGVDSARPLETIERQDVGVSLQVAPVVTASGMVIMDVMTQADSLSDSMRAADVITNQRSIQTTVQIHSGQSVLLGGLVSEDTTETVSGVPGLSSIPGLGRLFESRSTTTQNRNLNVLLQATVLPRLGAI